MEKKEISGTHSLFIFRGWGQNSLQATVEKAPRERPLLIPRSGTAAPIGATSMMRQPIKKGR